METRTTITVTLFGDDSSFERRRYFRDAVDSALQQAGLGAYIGGGSMVTDEPNYDVQFDVTDESRGLALIRDTLRASAVGQSTEMTIGVDRRYSVYDDTWTDLGPRLSSHSRADGGDDLAKLSGGDFLQNLKHITDEARKKHGRTKDPNQRA